MDRVLGHEEWHEHEREEAQSGTQEHVGGQVGEGWFRHAAEQLEHARAEVQALQDRKKKSVSMVVVARF